MPEEPPGRRRERADAADQTNRSLNRRKPPLLFESVPCKHQGIGGSFRNKWIRPFLWSSFRRARLPAELALTTRLSPRPERIRRQTDKGVIGTNSFGEPQAFAADRRLDTREADVELDPPVEGPLRAPPVFGKARRGVVVVLRKRVATQSGAARRVLRVPPRPNESGGCFRIHIRRSFFRAQGASRIRRRSVPNADRTIEATPALRALRPTRPVAVGLSTEKRATNEKGRTPG
jgi:hypothetical protein